MLNAHAELSEVRVVPEGRANGDSPAWALAPLWVPADTATAANIISTPP